jgi:hypothetical protein
LAEFSCCISQLKAEVPKVRSVHHGREGGGVEHVFLIYFVGTVYFSYNTAEFRLSKRLFLTHLLEGWLVGQITKRENLGHIFYPKDFVEVNNVKKIAMEFRSISKIT